MGQVGGIEVEGPFNAPNDRPCRILIDEWPATLFGVGLYYDSVPILRPIHDPRRNALFSRAVREGLKPRFL